jgi:hypothetical protein
VVQGRLLYLHKRDASAPRPKRDIDSYFETRKLEAQSLNEALSRFKGDAFTVEFYEVVGINREWYRNKRLGRVSAKDEQVLGDRHTRLTLASYVMDKMERIFRECNDADSVNLYMHAATSLRKTLLTDDYFKKPLTQIRDDFVAVSGFLQAISAKTGIEILEADQAVEAYRDVVSQKIGHRVGIYAE